MLMLSLGGSAARPAGCWQGPHGHIPALGGPLCRPGTSANMLTCVALPLTLPGVGAPGNGCSWRWGLPGVGAAGNGCSQRWVLLGMSALGRGGCWVWVVPGRGAPRDGWSQGWVVSGMGVSRDGCSWGWLLPGVGAAEDKCSRGWVLLGRGVPRASWRAQRCSSIHVLVAAGTAAHQCGTSTRTAWHPAQEMSCANASLSRSKSLCSRIIRVVFL